MKTKLILDIHKVEHAQLNYIVMGRVGDKASNVVDVYVVDGGVPYALTGLTLFYECLKPDNTVVRDSKGIKMIDATKGHFEYTFPPEVFAVPGKAKQSFFSLEKDKTVRATTQDFVLVSLCDALTGNVPSGSFISDLEKLVDEANKVIKHIKELEQQAAGIIDKEIVDIRKKADKLMKDIQAAADKVIQGIDADFDAVKNQVEELQKKVDKMDVVKKSGDTMTGNLTVPRLYAGSSPDKQANVGTGSSDVYLANTLSKKFLQLKDAGALCYSNIPVALSDTAQMQKVTLDNGGATISVSDTSKNILEEIKAKGSGMNTIYCVSGAQGQTPNNKSWRGVSFLNSASYGLVWAKDFHGKFFTNYLDNGNWKGWIEHPSLTDVVKKSGDTMSGDLNIDGEFLIKNKPQAPTNAAVWYSAEKTKYGSGESVISQKAAPRWAAGRTVDMSSDGTYRIQEDGIYDIQAFLRIGAAAQDTQHILSIHILNSAGQLVEELEIAVDFVKISVGHNRFHGSLRWGFKKGEQFRFVYRHNSQQEVERQNSRLSITRLTYGLEEENV